MVGKPRIDLFRSLHNSFWHTSTGFCLQPPFIQWLTGEDKFSFFLCLGLSEDCSFGGNDGSFWKLIWKMMYIVDDRDVAFSAYKCLSSFIQSHSVSRYWYFIDWLIDWLIDIDWYWLIDWLIYIDLFILIDWFWLINKI